MALITGLTTVIARGHLSTTGFKLALVALESYPEGMKHRQPTTSYDSLPRSGAVSPPGLSQQLDYLLASRGPQRAASQQQEDGPLAEASSHKSEEISSGVSTTAVARSKSGSPRHRALLERALEATPKHTNKSLADPHRSVTRWQVPTGALIVLVVILAGVLAWPLLTGGWGAGGTVPGSAGSQQTLPIPAPSTEGDGTQFMGGSDGGQEADRSSVTAPVSASALGSPPPVIVVHITGAVVSPGVYEVPAGSRLHQAVEAAGGPLPEANTGAINLAGQVEDGTQVYIPVQGEDTTNLSQNPGRVQSGAATAPQNQGAGGMVNINTATAEELQTLPKVGPVLAQAIISWREEYGGFTSVDELDQVSGIGPATLEALRPLVTV